MLNQYITPLITKYNCKIYGWADTWKTGKSIKDNDVPKLFASAKICPSVSESHTFHHPVDVPERVFKVPVAGGFTIHTYSPAIKDLFGDVIPTANNQTKWMNIIDHYLNDNEARSILAKQQQQYILNKHTYFDRAVVFARHLNNKELITALEKTKQSIVDTAF